MSLLNENKTIDTLGLVKVIIPFGFFIFGIYRGYIGNITSCRVREVFDKHVSLTHLVALISLWQLIYLVEPKYNSVNPIYVFLGAIVLYTLFILINRVHMPVFIILLGLIAFIYILDIYKNYTIEVYRRNNEVSKIKEYETNIIRAQILISSIGGLVLIGGVIAYFAKQYEEHGDKFKLSTFIFGNINCGYKNIVQ